MHQPISRVNVIPLLILRPRHLMSSVQAIVREASLVPVHLPNINALKEALAKAREWSSKVDRVQVLTSIRFIFQNKLVIVLSLNKC